MSIIFQAIEVAAKAHNLQFRKATDVPYISHPYSVGMLLLQNGCSEEVVAEGILHDTVEDTALTLFDIRNMFGETVTQLVKGASEENKELSWEERKQTTISHLANASKDLCFIVCADKLHNLRTISQSIDEHGDKVWKRFKRGKEKQEWYYRSVAEQLSKQLKNEWMYNEFLVEIEQVFG